jgi:hypothetical protein
VPDANITSRREGAWGMFISAKIPAP